MEEKTPKNQNILLYSIIIGFLIFLIGSVIYLYPNTKINTKSVTKFEPAAEIENIEAWINSEPLTIAELRGKVILIDFWTYSCINCIRTLPFITEWDEKYRDDGLVVIGIHSPEFQFEKKLENVQDAVDEYRIEYAVGLDNDFTTWRNFNNRYWPAKYFIDRNGNLRHTHFGEGEYSESEEMIQKLLAEDVDEDFSFEEVSNVFDTPPISAIQTPETYLGYSRLENMVNSSQLKFDTTQTYQFDGELNAHEWALLDDWEVTDEASISRSANSTLLLNFTAKEVYLVIESETPAKMKVYVDDQLVSELGLSHEDVDENSEITITEPRLYQLVRSDEMLQGSILRLEFEEGISINAFTFGS